MNDRIPSAARRHSRTSRLVELIMPCRLLFALGCWFGMMCQGASAADPAAGNAWPTLEPPGEGFRIELPGKPEVQNGEVDTPAGKIFVRLYLLADENRRRIYNVSVNRLPKAPAEGELDGVLDRARDGALKSAQGKLLDEQKLKLDRYQGRALTVEAPGPLFVHARLLIADERLYQIGIVSDSRELSDEDKRVFSSLSIRDAKLVDLQPKIDWRFVTPRGEKLAVEMPDDPKESTAALDTPLGRVKLTRLECTIAGRLYFVQICELPAVVGGNDQAKLDAARDHALQAVGGKTIEETTLKRDQRPGRAAVISAGERTLRLQTFVDGVRTYQLGTLGPGATATPEELQFFNSLKLPPIAPQ